MQYTSPEKPGAEWKISILSLSLVQRNQCTLQAPTVGTAAAREIHRQFYGELHPEVRSPQLVSETVIRTPAHYAMIPFARVLIKTFVVVVSDEVVDLELAK